MRRFLVIACLQLFAHVVFCIALLVAVCMKDPVLTLLFGLAYMATMAGALCAFALHGLVKEIEADNAARDAEQKVSEAKARRLQMEQALEQNADVVMLHI